MISVRSQEISRDSSTGFVNSLTISSAGGSVTTSRIYVRFSPTAVQSYTGNISNVSTGASTQNVSVSGIGIQSEDGASIKPVVASNSISKGTEFWVEVKVGDPNIVNDLYGISFRLSSNNSNCTYVDQSATQGDFLGSSVIPFSQKFDDQTVDVAITKTSQPGVSGSGIVAKAKFTSSSNIISDQTVVFSLSNITATNSSGNNIAMTPTTVTVTIKATVTVNVWPGDCNNDLIVSASDILPIGQYYNQERPGSNIPGTQWQAFQRQPWTADVNTPKRIYADANGDGAINVSDVLAVGLNYGKTHSSSNSVTQSVANTLGNILAKKNLANASLGLSGPAKVRNNTNFTIEVKIGDPIAVTDLYGISFKIKSNSATCSYVDNSAQEGTFLGNSILKFFQKIDAQTVDAALSKTSAPGVSGSGTIAKFDFKSTVDQIVTFTLTNVTATNSQGNTILLDVLPINIIVDVNDNDIVSLPNEYKVEQNYPNPFNPTTTIKYSIAPPNLPKGEAVQHVSLKVYDLLGREVATLVNEEKAPGNYEVTFNAETRRGESLPSGVYFYRLTAGLYSETKKMILLK